MAPSELILNDDGSIYHLHLKPQDIAPTLFFVGDPERVPKVSGLFDEIEFTVAKREFVTHTGRVGEKRVSVISTGIGTDNIDIVLNELDALVNLDLQTGKEKRQKTKLNIIRMGTSGSIQSDVKIDSLLISEAAIGFDGLLHFYAGQKLKRHPILKALNAHAKGVWSFPAKPYLAPADPQLFAAFSPYIPQHGITATNSGFYAPQGRWLRAKPQHPDLTGWLAKFNFEGHRITNLEMETAGIYGMASLLGHRALSINAILASRAEGLFSATPEHIVGDMLEMVVRKIVPNLP